MADRDLRKTQLCFGVGACTATVFFLLHSAGGARATTGSVSVAPPIATPPPVVRFVDTTERAGLGAFAHVAGGPAERSIIESFAAGVALLDVDRDGDLDVYLSNAGVALPDYRESSESTRDALFINDGAGNFRDETATRGLGDAGWTTGVCVADFDGDGSADLFLTGFASQAVYFGRSDGTFEERTTQAGLRSDAWGAGACCLDFDRDGDLDLYVAHYMEPDDVAGLDPTGRLLGRWMGRQVFYGRREFEGAADRLYRNRGDGTFEDVSRSVGIGASVRRSFQPVAFDADGDDWLDVLVVCDGQPNLVWRNVEGRRFEEVGAASGFATTIDGRAQACQGLAVGDVDGDGFQDLLASVASEDHSTFYRGGAHGRFRDETQRARLTQATTPFFGWSTGFADFDADGHLDLWCANGHIYPAADRVDSRFGHAQRKLVFLGDGDGRFRPVFDDGSALDRTGRARGGAAGDLDGDGDIDLVFGNLDGPPTVIMNQTARRGRVALVRLHDRAPNTMAHGAVVTAEVGRTARQVRAVGTGAGFLSSSSPDVHFGLGDAPRIDRLRVRWADGEVDSYPGVEGDFHVVIRRDHGIVRRWPLAAPR